MNCPNCKSVLEACGEVAMEGRKLLVYQCEACIRPWKVGQETFDTCLTFAVDEDGQMFDPETLEPLSLN